MTGNDLLNLYNEGRILILPTPLGTEVWKIHRQRDTYDDRPYYIATRHQFILEDVPNLGNSIFLTYEECVDAVALLNRKGK